MSLKTKTFAFLTQHGKDELLGPLFSEKLGCALVRATGYDTDQLGTFTRDVQRPGSQLAAAAFKARKAVELSGIPFGLGSEGAFGADPVGGLVPWNTEVLVLCDGERNLDFVGLAQGPSSGLHKTVSDEEELLRFVREAGFPSHGIVLRAADAQDPPIFKGLCDTNKLLEAYRTSVASSGSGKVLAEIDLRAHMNPTRQQMIIRAAEDLIAKLLSECPQCQAPGFWEKERVSGLPCGVCYRPTRLPLAKIWKCDACGHSESLNHAVDQLADPGKCDHCNP